jgi:pyruvate/2-oxoglutarate dehydrogenase complex dihydrolipoamide acyltransferase (E2) component
MFINRNHFGSVLLTNVSSFGIENVYGPLCSFTRNISTVVICTPALKPRVVDGEVKIRKIMNIMFTFDHRYQDGSGVPKIMNAFNDVWRNP